MKRPDKSNFILPPKVAGSPRIIHVKAYATALEQYATYLEDRIKKLKRGEAKPPPLEWNKWTTNAN